MVPERRNYKLYKAKKQWITACATFLLTFSATAVMNVSAQAADNPTSADEPVAEVNSTNNTSSSNPTVGLKASGPSSTLAEQPTSSSVSTKSATVAASTAVKDSATAEKSSETVQENNEAPSNLSESNAALATAQKIVTTQEAEKTIEYDKNWNTSKPDNTWQVEEIEHHLGVKSDSDENKVINEHAGLIIKAPYAKTTDGNVVKNF